MNKDVVLENDVVQLIPLKTEHWEQLWDVAKQMDLYQYGSSDVSSLDKLKNYIKTAISDEKAIPFLVIDKRNNKVVGCTRFGLIDSKNKVLHIGWTWISTATQGTGLNHQMKYLMLNHTFETLKFEKVEFRIDERNIKSKKAVEKLGAKLEGVLRKNVITKNNFRRSSCCYGILKEEWETIKENNFN